MSFLNPTPRFPPYSGPHNVGTAECEFSVANLDSPAESPDPSISTVKFRLFYPTDAALDPSNAPRWLPEPQRESLSAFGRFLGAGAIISEIFSYLPTLISRTTIPVVPNAPLRAPSKNGGKWPVLIFSHGLGGTCNSYSHLLGSLASHGLVVVAPEHRDGSSPLSRINAPENGLVKIGYQHIEHALTPEVKMARNEQLRIRLWELGLIHDAVLRLDAGRIPENLITPMSKAAGGSPNFKSRLDVHEPGSIAWAGHSFGAATMVQFQKSVFYRSPLESEWEASSSDSKPLLNVSEDANITRQITATSPLILLDLWTLPLRGDEPLFAKPLPSYSRPDNSADTRKHSPSVLAILSEEFFKWSRNFQTTTRILSSNPATTSPTLTTSTHPPRIFYPLHSAHLSQSDFGVLFPWLTKKWMGADEPERTLRLNVRAILQMLRENGFVVEKTARIDKEEGAEVEEAEVVVEKGDLDGARDEEDEEQDFSIMAQDGRIRGWLAISMGEVAKQTEKGRL